MNKNLSNLIFIIGKNSTFFGLERIHNVVFLLQKQNNNLFNYSFKRGNYGPFSSELNSDLNFLIQSKLVNSDYSGKTHEKTYSLTILGYQPYHNNLNNNSYVFSSKDIDLIDNMIILSKNEYRNFIYKNLKIYDFEIGDQLF